MAMRSGPCGTGGNAETGVNFNLRRAELSQADPLKVRLGRTEIRTSEISHEPPDGRIRFVTS
jgi:hypothetical protein